ncbi:mCG23188, isoform CRA_c [Mus musculus]|nr:mCG23188, isoform CRA_c [Mus musculus]
MERLAEVTDQWITDSQAQQWWPRTLILGLRRQRRAEFEANLVVYRATGQLGVCSETLPRKDKQTNEIS